MSKSVGATTESSTSTTYTKWDAFDRAHLVPVTITCDGYHPVHYVNNGCHSKTVLSAEAIINHMRADHGNGFQIQLRVTDGKGWPGWKALKDAGIEIVDLRCDVCDKTLPLHPQHLLGCMRAHAGKTKRARQGGLYNLTLSFNKPIAAEEDPYDFND
jgi:hypothetical protein